MTLDQAIDAAMQLTLDQRAMLLDILQSRQIEARRNEMAMDAEESLAEFRAGKLRARGVEHALDELHQAAMDEE